MNVWAHRLKFSCYVAFSTEIQFFSSEVKWYAIAHSLDDLVYDLVYSQSFFFFDFW